MSKSRPPATPHSITLAELEGQFGPILGDGVDLSDIAWARKEPWAKQWLDDVRYLPISITSRKQKATGQDDFFARTLQTSTTIPHWLYLVHNALLTGSTGGYIPGRENPGLVLFVALEQGVNGFRNTAHGGVLCGLLDEAQSTCVEFHRRAQSTEAESLYTATLNVEFRKPVSTPALVMAKAWLSKVEGRKWHVVGEIVDSYGYVCAKSSSLWITPRTARM